MPELPEVETVVRTLRPMIVGRRILNAEFRQLRVLRGSAQETMEALAGRKIKSIERKAAPGAPSAARECPSPER